GDQRIYAGGRAGKTGPLDLTVELERFRIGTVSDLLGIPALRGEISGSLALSGSADAPELEARAQGVLNPENVQASELELTASYRERSLSFEARMGMGTRQWLRANGSLPVVFSLSDTTWGFLESEPMTAQAQVDSLSLAWLGLFVSPEVVRNLEGVANGSLRLEGSPGDPALEGELALARVGVGLPSLGLRYGRGRGRMRFQGDRILLDTLLVHSGDGVLSGSGSVSFPSLSEPEYDLRVRARNFRAVSTSGMMAVISGDLQVSGNAMSPSVTGDLEVLESDLYLGDLTSNPDLDTVALSEEDYRELARVFGYRRPGPTERPSDVLMNSSLDLRVDLRRDSWVRQRTNPDLSVQFSGNLSVQKASGDPIRLVGEVSAIPERSYVEQFGRRFSLTRGDLVFQGAPSATQVDLRGEYEVPSRDNPQSPEVVIALDITGTPGDLRLELSSTPSLEASDMVSYLAVGRPADQSLSGGGGGSLTGTGGALALNRLSGAVEAYAREQVGLDVVEITTDGLEGVTLLAGRYVSPGL
ncbi:MAG: translocation/assembly module TamB, partial [Longimicrobiales bacterium]|nr:translocation/assembly module TamB [Longimicrobiales bacterium]